jgi:hypothetical protein
MIGNVSAVAIHVPPPRATPTGPRVRWSNTIVNEPNPTPELTHLIDDLCSAPSAQGPDCIGCLEADDHRFVLYPTPQTTSFSNACAATLEQLLGGPHALTRRKRYTLAFTLASSYIQLDATPWLNTHLSKNIILFLRDSGDPQSPTKPQPIRCPAWESDCWSFVSVLR